MFSASQISKYFGSVAVLRKVSVRISPGERIGVIGRNGAGKTTLLRCLAGLLEVDEGQLHMPRNARIAYLSQREPLPLDASMATGTDCAETVGEKDSWIRLPVYEAALSVFGHLQEQERTLRELEQAMGSGDDPALLARYGEALEAFEQAGGYEYRHRTAAVLTGLGFAPDRWQQRADSLSGGELMRLALARLLLAEPDLALLDEPTNHLDLEAIEWLEGFLQRFRGAVVVVSHDRRFLDRVTHRTWEVEEGSVVDYPAPYSAAMEQKAVRLKRLAKEREAYEREKAKLEHFIARFRAGSRASQAKDRQRKLERLVPPPVNVRSSRELRLRFASNRSLEGSVVCWVQELSLGYPGREPLLTDVSLNIPAGARIGLVGPNGAGKSTLLKGLWGELSPLRGSVEWGQGVQLGYFSQDGRELDDGETVLEALLSRHPMSYQQAREALAAFFFSGDRVEQAVGTLSGGERARLSLLLVMLSGANVLLLDEPTNHLDLPAREALEDALAAYDGTLIVVSHDRYFLDRVTTSTWWIEDGTVRTWDGPYSAAREAMLGDPGRGGSHGARSASGGAQPDPPGEEVGKKSISSRAGRGAHSGRKRNAGAELAALETSIEALEEERAALEASLADPETYQGGDAAEVVNRYRRVEEELAALYQRWEALVEELGG